MNKQIKHRLTSSSHKAPLLHSAVSSSVPLPPWGSAGRAPGNPLLREKNYLFLFYISYFPWPDPGSLTLFIQLWSYLNAGSPALFLHNDLPPRFILPRYGFSIFNFGSNNAGQPWGIHRQSPPVLKSPRLNPDEVERETPGKSSHPSQQPMIKHASPFNLKFPSAL